MNSSSATKHTTVSNVVMLPSSANCPGDTTARCMPLLKFAAALKTHTTSKNRPNAFEGFKRWLSCTTGFAR